jgi:hypothetical protein
MQVSLTHPVPPAHAISAADIEDTLYDARLRGRSQQELFDAMTWLSWYASGVFTAVLDYMESCDA